jgi:hypothetical protein
MKLAGQVSSKTSKNLLHPDILYSNIQHKVEKSIKYNQNTFEIKKKNDKYFVYHTFVSSDNKLYGRWYNTSLDPTTDFKFTETPTTKKITYIIPEYEVRSLNNTYKTLRNVKVNIYFTEKGWNLLTSYIK